MKTVTIKGGRAGLMKWLSALPAAMSGRAADRRREADAVMLAGGLAALSLVQAAFIERSRGRRDEANMRWKPLAKSTLEARRRDGRAPDILRVTGALFNSLSGDAKQAPLRLIDVAMPFLKIGTLCPYAAYQHFGTKRIPARPLWPPLADWPRRWWQEIGNAMMAAAASALAARGAR